MLGIKDSFSLENTEQRKPHALTWTAEPSAGCCLSRSLVQSSKPSGKNPSLGIEPLVPVRGLKPEEVIASPRPLKLHCGNRHAGASAGASKSATPGCPRRLTASAGAQAGFQVRTPGISQPRPLKESMPTSIRPFLCEYGIFSFYASSKQEFPFHIFT